MLNDKTPITMSAENLKVAKIKDAAKMLSAVLPVDQIVLVNADVLPLEQVAQVTIETIGEELQSLLDVKKRIADLPKVSDVSQIAEMEDWKAVAKELVKLRTASTKKLDAAKRKYMETDRQIVKIRNTVEATFEALEEEARQNGEFLKRIQDAEADAEAQRRLDALAKFGYHAKTFKEVRAMDAEVFEAFLTKVENDYKAALEAERLQKEAAERVEKQKQIELRNASRLRLVEPYSEYFVFKIEELEEFEDAEFEACLDSAKQAKAEADAIEKQKRAAKDALRNARFAEIGPYAAFARHSGDLADLDEEAFSKLLEFAKSAKNADDAEKAKQAEEKAKQAAKEAEERAIAKAKAEAEAAEKARIEAEKAEIARKEAEAKAKADALAKAGDGEKLKHFANALLEALKQAPETLETAQAKVEVDAIANRITAFSNYVKEKYQ